MENNNNMNNNNFIILGKSNASVAMINEILYENYHGNMEITIVKNMEDTTELEYKVEGVNMKEYLDRDFEVFTPINTNYVIGAYRAAAKKAIYNYFENKYSIQYRTHNFPSIISPNAFIASTVNMGSGCIISHKCVIDSYSKLGNFVTLNRCSSIGHHTYIDDFTSINPNAHVAGNCKIGKNVQIGMGTNIIDGITIGDNSIIGANSFVNKNVPSNVLVYGTPAKVIKELADREV